LTLAGNAGDDAAVKTSFDGTRAFPAQLPSRQYRRSKCYRTVKTAP